jgi:hypothetical protein
LIDEYDAFIEIIEHNSNERRARLTQARRWRSVTLHCSEMPAGEVAAVVRHFSCASDTIAAVAPLSKGAVRWFSASA